MATLGSDLESRDLESVLLTEREVWEHGVPNELFGRLRANARCTGPTA